MNTPDSIHEYGTHIGDVCMLFDKDEKYSKDITITEIAEDGKSLMVDDKSISFI